MRPRSFCDTRSIRSNCFPGAGLIRSHRCKRRRCTDGAAAGRARHAAVLHCGAGSCGSALEAPQRLPARRCAIRPLEQRRYRGWGAGRAVAPCRCHPAPQPSCFRSPAIRTEAGKPRFSPAKRCASPQTGIRSPLPAVLALHLSPTAKAPRPVPGTTRDPTGKIAEGKSGRWGIGQASAARRRAIQKRPPRAESGKGVSNNLWQRPTFPHDVMQYHRRWRA